MKSHHYYPCSTVEETGTQELNPFTPGHAASMEVRKLDWNLVSLQLRVYTLLLFFFCTLPVMPSFLRLFRRLVLNVMQDFSFSESSFNRFSEKLALRDEAFS